MTTSMAIRRPFAGLIRSDEGRYLSRFDSIVVLSAKDAELVHSLYGAEAVIDEWEDLWGGGAGPQETPVRDDYDRLAARLVYYGNMRRFENWSAALTFAAAAGFG